MARRLTVKCCVQVCGNQVWVSDEWKQAKCSDHCRQDEIERAIDLAYEDTCYDDGEVARAYMETMRPYYRARKRRKVVS